ncbi:carboxymuconolactone decarboxylase family protein, partial [Mycobacterium tuberculosis]|nr:carboxymuconolactone decarboxylase family protein [Mycobacterium tuberculosis]
MTKPPESPEVFAASQRHDAIREQAGYQNGLSREEIVELFTHLAFYAGWPAAASALTCLNAQ